MSTKKALREITKDAEAMGFKVTDISYGRHVRMTLTRPEWNGKTRTMITAISASDFRAMKNIHKTLKNMEAPL